MPAQAGVPFHFPLRCFSQLNLSTLCEELNLSKAGHPWAVSLWPPPPPSLSQFPPPRPSCLGCRGSTVSLRSCASCFQLLSPLMYWTAGGADGFWLGPLCLNLAVICTGPCSPDISGLSPDSVGVTPCPPGHCQCDPGMINCTF
jgi:hypothetical protein